jgi:hypothetical protein
VSEVGSKKRLLGVAVSVKQVAGPGVQNESIFSDVLAPKKCSGRSGIADSTQLSEKNLLSTVSCKRSRVSSTRDVGLDPKLHEARCCRRRAAKIIVSEEVSREVQ